MHKFDRRRESFAYISPPGSKVNESSILIIGAGPAGLRTAIECMFLGCKNVVVIEKRPEFTRNNIVHLWSFVIRLVFVLLTVTLSIFFYQRPH